MKLSLITLNYNGSENTINLLRSFKDQTDKNFEIIVIDNASEEADFNDLEQGIKRHDIFNQVLPASLIRNDKNMGFSGGNNIGIKKALQSNSNWVVLINNDTFVENYFIATLKSKLAGLNGIVGIPLIERDRTAYCGKISWLKSTLKHIYNPPYAEYLRKNSYYYAIGGAMAIHVDVFKKIGFLDEKYFLYFEDADFNMRAIRAGISINFIDEPKVRHLISETTSKLGSPLLLRYHYRNSLYFNSKNGPNFVRILVWFWGFWIMKKQLFKLMIIYKREESLEILKGVIDFYRNKMGQVVNFLDAPKAVPGDTEKSIT